MKMTTKTYIIDGANFNNFAEFTQEFLRVFADIDPYPDEYLNLDAFNDYLDWPSQMTGEGYTIIWRNSDLSRERLGYAEMAAWCQRKVSAGYFAFSESLHEADRQEGPTLFDNLLEIIGHHP
jgi:hypothetical protein